MRRPPSRCMVARSRSGARSGTRGAQRFSASLSPDQPLPEPLSARIPVISCSSSGTGGQPAAGNPQGVLRPRGLHQRQGRRVLRLEQAGQGGPGCSFVIGHGGSFRDGWGAASCRRQAQGESRGGLPEAQRLPDVVGVRDVAPGQVRKGPREAQHAVVAAGGQHSALQGVVQDAGGGGIEPQGTRAAAAPAPARWFPSRTAAAGPAGGPGPPGPVPRCWRFLPRPQAGRSRRATPARLRAGCRPCPAAARTSGPDTGGAWWACRCSPLLCPWPCRRDRGWLQGPAGSGRDRPRTRPSGG